MSGHVYGEPEPTEECPYCGSKCHADYCDIGVGMIQCGPFHCTSCGASEVGPHDESRELTMAERMSGWYGPHSEPGSSANVIGGSVVDHKTMAGLYRLKFKGNPEYDIPGRVEGWLKSIRKP